MPAFTYRVQSVESGHLAHCCEMDVAAVGATKSMAIAALRRAIEERLAEPNAMAPPRVSRETEISLAEEAPRSDPGPQGPGEANAQD